jgi:hypothetical protein
MQEGEEGKGKKKEKSMPSDSAVDHPSPRGESQPLKF